MEWNNLFLIISNFFMIIAIRYSLKHNFYLEAWIFFQSMISSSFYHFSEIQNWNIYPSKHYDLYFALKVMDFYSAILVVVTLCIFTAKVTDDKKGLPHIFLGTCTIFTMSWGKWNLEKELFIISLCVLTMLIILFYKRKTLTRIKTNNLIKGVICIVIGVVCFHINLFYTNGEDKYWLFHSIWHISIMIATFYIMRIHPIDEIKKIKIDAIKKVNSIENYLELMATKTKELGIKISSTPSTPREVPIELNQISTI
tara:strand:- start:2136 stop:2900 length:765 start_codon:yes stop_codon:yes gene_type:complete